MNSQVFRHGRLRLRMLLLSIALVSPWTLTVALHAHGASPAQIQSGITSTPAVAAPARPPVERALGTVNKLRVGTHDGFKRIVFELAGPQEWSVERGGGGPIRIVIPGVDLSPGVRRMEFARGPVRSIQPLRRSGGVEVLIVCEPDHVKLRTMTLTDPDRLVVDVSLPAAGETAVARASLRPASRDGSTAATAESVPPAPATPPAAVAPIPSAPEPLSRPSPRLATPARPPAGGTQTVPGPVDAPPLTVVLDPGHGGHDTGAIGPSGLMEKDVVLDLALRLRRLLQERLGVRVLMTRTEDVFVPLPERSAFANRVKADFLISLHVNAASKRGAVGFETFYFTREPSDNDARASTQRENLVIENNGTTGKDLESLLKTTLADMAVTRDMKESSNLAERILSSLETILRVENRGVKSGPFYVLATAAMPAVLVESAFITNPREERKLQREEYREQIARALFDGIAAYKVRYQQRLGQRNAPTGVGS